MPYALATKATAKDALATWESRRARTLLTSSDATGGYIYGDELIARYVRREFTDPRNVKVGEVKWYLETVRQVKRHIYSDFKDLAIAISEIQVYRNLYYKVTPKASEQQRNAAVTYGVPRLLFITPKGIAAPFSIFEEVAHSLDYPCPYENLCPPDKMSDDQLVNWWIRHATAQQLQRGSTVPQPLRCHLAIYNAFLGFANAQAPVAPGVTMKEAQSRVEKRKTDVEERGCRDRTKGGGCFCYS